MAEGTTRQFDSGRTPSNARIERFEISGLFGRQLNHAIDFPLETTAKGEPSLLILSGPNGCGKTTILRMIEGMLALDFDMFRRMPFKNAVLTLSTGEKLVVDRTTNSTFPLHVAFEECAAELASTQAGPYDDRQAALLQAFRAKGLPVLNGVHYELLDIHRSLALRGGDNQEESLRVGLPRNRALLRQIEERSNTLASRVKNFIREAQVNYRKYFQAERLELLPRILQRLRQTNEVRKDTLNAKVARIQARIPELARMGLETDEADLNTLSQLLAQKDQFSDKASLAVFEAYVEMQESRDQTRELIAKRLESFEGIMADFLVGKTVRIDANTGLRITASTGELRETDLSSGEYHFLYMMVSALLCFRTGSIIAIDEPELSLHVTWQRKVVSALARCAAGASPLFLFATHSSAISAEHTHQVQFLAVEDLQ